MVSLNAEHIRSSYKPLGEHILHGLWEDLLEYNSYIFPKSTSVQAIFHLGVWQDYLQLEMCAMSDLGKGKENEVLNLYGD